MQSESQNQPLQYQNQGQEVVGVTTTTTTNTNNNNNPQIRPYYPEVNQYRQILPQQQPYFNQNYLPPQPQELIGTSGMTPFRPPQQQEIQVQLQPMQLLGTNSYHPNNNNLGDSTFQPMLTSPQTFPNMVASADTLKA